MFHDPHCSLAEGDSIVWRRQALKKSPHVPGGFLKRQAFPILISAHYFDLAMFLVVLLEYS